MAEGDTDPADDLEAEREAEIKEELDRIDRDPDETDDGDDSLGTQNAPRSEEEDELEEDAETE